MNPARRLIPQTLFGRAVLTLVLTFGLFALLTLGAVSYYALIPVAQRSADDLVSFMLLSAQSWVILPPNLRPAYAERVLKEHEIWLLKPDGEIDENDYFLPYVTRVESALDKRLDFPVPVRSRVIEGRRWFFIDLKFGHEELRLGFPRDRITTRPLTGLVVLGLFSLSLVLVTAAILARGITAPLTRLSHAAREVANGRSPQPLPEKGPRELASLAHQFNHMTHQVRELLANRTTLLSGISHDLRTPITRLRLSLEMLPSYTDRKLRQRMERDLEQMSELISEAMELARGLGGNERKEADLSTLMDELVEGRANLDWHNPGPCLHPINAPALRRILGNLLDNALRYGGDEPVRVELRCDPQRPCFAISDRGPGIPEDLKDAVFRPFYRMERSRSRETGGSGLGLAIVRQLAEGNGIDVKLQDRDGGGTVARVELAGSDSQAAA